MTDEVARLERQVERSHVRFQSLANRSFERIRTLESAVQAMTDLLVRHGVIAKAELDSASAGAATGLEERADGEPERVTLRPEAAATPPAEAVVDCAARMHVCRAVCCKLTVVLSASEVEAGRVRWDLGRPYVLRREADASCTHNDRQTGFCSVYADRPAPCRQYSCANDGRIWKDFARMELNTEWLSAHFKPDEPTFVALDPPGTRRRDA